MTRRIEYAAASLVHIEVQSPGVRGDDPDEADVLIIRTEGSELRISGWLDDLAQRLNDELRKQGWDGAR